MRIVNQTRSTLLSLGAAVNLQGMLEKRLSRRPSLTIVILIILAGTVSVIGAPAPATEILGISLNMSQEEAQRRLREIGTFERQERKQQEIWKVRDRSFSHLIIAFNEEGQMRFITAVAREDEEAKRVEYGEFADLQKARQAGDVSVHNYNYQWDFPAERGKPPVQVSARGRDPKFLSTYSIRRLPGA